MSSRIRVTFFLCRTGKGEGRLSQTHYGPVPGGYTGALQERGLPHQQRPAREGEGEEFPWDLAPGEVASLCRSRMDPGVFPRGLCPWPVFPDTPGPRSPPGTWMPSQQGTQTRTRACTCLSRQAQACGAEPVILHQVVSLGPLVPWMLSWWSLNEVVRVRLHMSLLSVWNLGCFFF